MRVLKLDSQKNGTGKNKLDNLKIVNHSHLTSNSSLRLIFAFSSLFYILPECFSQTASKNYITTYHPQIAVTNEWAVSGLSKENGQKSIKYVDGIGRTDQVIQVAGSPLGYDLVKPVSYDAFGHELRKFLPNTLNTANNGTYVVNDSLGQSSYFTGLYGASDGPNAFAKTEFEPSPLNRVLKQGAPGLAWQPNTVAANDHSVKFDYSSNIATDSVRLWTINSSNTPTTSAFYPVNSLSKTTSWDENSNQTSSSASRSEVYKDIQGKVVLKRAFDGTKKYSTYYIYDNLELLRFVLPPQTFADGSFTISASKLNDYCYQYRYDERKRVIKKKIPGADSTIMVYDARDRLVLLQDGVSRPNNKWFFTKYDEIDRPVITGRISLTGLSADTLRARFGRYCRNVTDTLYESKVSTGNWGYSLNKSYPSTIAIADTNILGINYYDNYAHLSVSGFKPVAFNKAYCIDTDPDNDGNNDGYFDVAKGMVTGTKMKVLDGNEYTSSAKWLCNANYYNDRYRLIQNKQTLYSGGAIGADTLIVSCLYDFMGKVLQTQQVQTFNSVTTIVNKYFNFDHLGRLITTAQQITGDVANGKVTVAQNSYNESSLLISKQLHKANSYGFLQNVNYAYNIRGWLTTINNPDSLSTLHPGDPNLDLFGERLLYQTSETGLNSSYPVQYNGNISAMVWNTTQKTKQGYGFSYDGLNRLTYGDHKSYTTAWIDDNNYEEKSLAYDMNGNISRLVRTNSSGTTMADYTYTYGGNKLSNINGGTTYSYDQNGNATLDGLRGASIAYNILNLPKTVSSGSDNISYVYSVAGAKLAKKMKDNTYQYYTGNMVYKNDKSLNYLLFEEGMVIMSSGGYAYEYHMKDHLGNTRVAFQPNGSSTTTTQVAEYYPFGSSYIPITPAGTNKYLFCGKENQDDVLGGTTLGWYDSSARFYDPQIGRWNVMDRFAEKYSQLSPYQYCINNPLIYTDPSGNDTETNDNSSNTVKTWDDYNNEGLPPTTWGGGGGYGTGGNAGFLAYMSATAQGYTGGMNEFEDSYHKQGNSGTFSYKSGSYYFIPIELSDETGAYVAERKVYETVTIDVSSTGSDANNLGKNLMNSLSNIGTLISSVGQMLKALDKGPIYILGKFTPGKVMGTGIVFSGVSLLWSFGLARQDNFNSVNAAQNLSDIMLNLPGLFMGGWLGFSYGLFSYPMQTARDNVAGYANQNNIPFQYIHVGSIGPSDIKLKCNIKPIKNGLDMVLHLGGYTYTWKDSLNKNDIGVIAQEVESVVPLAVTTDSIAGYKKVYYTKLIPVLIEAIKEQQKAIIRQQVEIDTLKSSILKKEK